MIFQDKKQFKGWTEHRVFDKNGKPKAQFQDNFIWRLINKFFQKDLQIPFVTGYWTLEPVRMNLVTTKGKEIIMKQLNGVTTAPVTAIAIGTNNTAAAAGNTALGAETTTSGGGRGAATCTNQTTTTSGDTARWVKTFTISGTLAIVEEGLFDNNTSGGNMLARQVFSTVNLVNGDSYQITHNIQAL